MDEKKLQILQAAIGVVTQYGYKRCTMDDIANAAGISRPALYLHFANKEDIFISGIEYVNEQAFEIAEGALENAGKKTSDRLKAYIVSYLTYYFRLTIAGPHSEELTALHLKLGAEQNNIAQNRFIARINQIARKKPNDEFGLILVHSGSGIKHQAEDEAVLVTRLGRLIDGLSE